MPKAKASRQTKQPYERQKPKKSPSPPANTRYPPKLAQRTGLVFGCGSNAVSGAVGVHPDRVDEIPIPRKLKNLSGLAAVGLTAGGMHSAAITGQGKIYTCGVNDQGCLGRITKDRPNDQVEDAESTPAIVQGPAEELTFCKVVAGDNITAALTQDGKVYACGRFHEPEGPIGFHPGKKEMQPILVNIDPKMTFVDVAVGFNHIIMLTAKGKVLSMGDNNFGQLGRRVTPRHMQNALRPEAVSGLRNIETIWAGANQNYAKAQDGTVYSWGSNSVGQLGRPKSNDTSINIFPKSLDIENVKDVAIGDFHTVFHKTDGSISAIGRADRGYLGVGQFPEPDTHIPQNVMENIESIAAGSNHTIAIKSDGSVHVWGSGASYVLGLGEDDDEDRFIPTLIPQEHWKGGRVLSATAGAQHSLFLVEPEQMDED